MKNGGLVLAFCWAHVRRDFVRVGKGWPELKPWALAWLRRIRDLYAANRRRLDAPEDVTADQEVRRIVDTCASSSLRNWPPRPPDTVSQGVDQSTRPLGRSDAVRGRSADTHGQQRHGGRLRNPALGRKNSYGSGAEWSGRLAAMLFSLLATLEMWGINARFK